MSGRLVAEVLDFAPDDLTQLQTLVLVALAESARDSDRTARFKASNRALADRARSTPGTIDNTLKQLKDRGLIVPVHAKVHRGQSQEWTIPKMTEATRRAVWAKPEKASRGSEAKSPPDRRLRVIGE